VIWRAFLSGTNRIFAELDAELRRFGLDLGEYEILVNLSESPDHELRMSELADRVRQSRSRLTHTVGRMEAKGILVFRTNGYNGPWQIAKESPVAGFALYDEKCPVIVVKKMSSDAPQAFTLMHELAHVLLHKTSWIDDETDLRATQGREQEANLFAGLVLVPDHFLDSISDQTRPADVAMFNEWLKPQRKVWGVSTEVILRRLLAVGRLTQATYQAYRDWSLEAGQNTKEEGGTRMYRHREPKHIFGDRFVRTVLNSLNARRITLSKASSYLDSLKIADVHELERHYAGA